MRSFLKILIMVLGTGPIPLAIRQDVVPMQQTLNFYLDCEDCDFTLRR